VRQVKEFIFKMRWLFLVRVWWPLTAATSDSKSLRTNIMVDLETLGTEPGCKILSIGATVFGPWGCYKDDTFYLEIRMADQGRLVADQKTMDWWEGQDPNVRDALFGNQHEKVSIESALAAFQDYLIEMKDKYKEDVAIWGNGASFDSSILRAAYSVVLNQDSPWSGFNDRCYRTLKVLQPKVKLVRVGSHHNALDDALSQAYHAVAILHHMKYW
jgi:hypothetical protein